MQRLVLCGLLAFPLLAQQQQRNTFLDAYIKGREMRLEQEKLQLERERMEMERSLRQQELDLKRQEVAGPAPETAPNTDTGQLDAEIKRALTQLASTYPDLHEYLPEMGRLALFFTAAKVPGATPEMYLEGLYVMAKYAGFSAKRVRQRAQ